MKIKKLSQNIINKIAAGEVVERPSSVVKELVENSIDAGAMEISIVINNGGRNLISITDDGDGMSKEDLEISILPHTTSKLNEEDITDINHFGFRGEALPSIASVSRMNVISRYKDEQGHAWSLNIEGGEVVDLTPASLQKGTKIIVRDLFFSTPARLKFLKSERVETSQILDIVKKIALSHPEISFHLASEHKVLFSVKRVNLLNDIDNKRERVKEILGVDFINNSVDVKTNLNEITLSGWASLPTFNRGTSSELYLYINNRPVRDKILITSARVAYQDFLASNRYPTVVLFLNLPSRFVDVNVHPNKTEVRFRDENEMRSYLISSLRAAILSSSQRSSSNIGQNLIKSILPRGEISQQKTFNSFVQNAPHYNQAKVASESQVLRAFNQPSTFPSAKYEEVITTKEEKIEECPLGAARCQLHETYIVSQTKDSIIFVDQHAAHERLVYEELKKSYFSSEAKAQRLLIPEIVEFDDLSIANLISKKEEFAKFGLVFEIFGPNTLKVTQVPAILGNCNVNKLIKDLADDFLECDESITFNEKLEEILGSFACHHSIRKGRILSIGEMNSVLRSMENTIGSAQCNHGRPTYVELKLSDVEKIFGRK